MEMFNELFDLSAVATGAGLLGGGASAGIALFVSGTILKFVLRTLLTAVLTGIGFYVLLGVLGFEIVPKSEVQASTSHSLAMDDDTFSVQGVTPTPADEEEDSRRLVVKSPFRRG